MKSLNIAIQVKSVEQYVACATVFIGSQFLALGRVILGH